jgi:hypothetical protein
MYTPTIAKKHVVPRMEVNWPISVLTPDEHIEGNVEHISPEGVYISCDEPPPLQSSFRMLIKAPQREPLRVTAKVVWTSICSPDEGPSRLGVGVQFVYISEGDRQFLGKVIGRHYSRKRRTLAPPETVH